MASADPPMRLGVFGGTFDPPHLGHVRVTSDVADALELDRVLWIPARVSPLKAREETSEAEIRLELVREAVRADPRFQIDTRELGRPGPSYTVDTLAELREERPRDEIFLILGADQLAEFDRWRDPARIARLAKMAVMDRAELEAETLAAEVIRRIPELAGRLVVVPVGRVDVSSTEVRERVREGRDISDQVPCGVARRVRALGLYRG